MTISLCMIVKNEEDVLARCLNSAKDAMDEIIIVDTGSTDSTKEIAKTFTDKVFDFPWIQDFSAARNFSYDQATMDYQMWLDADDVISPESLEQILLLKDTLSADTDIVTMKYITHYDSEGNPSLSFRRERLTRREKNYRWQDPVHECIPLIGKVVDTEIVIHHRKEHVSDNPRRNLDIYENLEISGSPLSPRQQYYFARELMDNKQWIKSIYYFETFLDGGRGWEEDNITSCFNLSLCYRILGNSEKAHQALLRSFRYDTPRAEICSEIGYIYKRQRNFTKALKWFELAAGLEIPASHGFILLDYWGYIPNIESCVCCCELGDYEKAYEYNERAAEFKQTGVIEQNRKYLLGKLAPDRTGQILA